jgi:tetratricopeptide (TPR) repeat protein
VSAVRFLSIPAALIRPFLFSLFMTVDERHIRAAQGFIDLDLHEDAVRELEGLSAEGRGRFDAIETRLLCELHVQNWGEGLRLGQLLCELEPKSHVGYVHSAYCLHEMGCTKEAVLQLERGPASLKTKALYYYNLGCYHTQLGDLDKALGLLQRSFELDDGLRRAARRDPDLQPLLGQLL